jgi:hypothetical protein
VTAFSKLYVGEQQDAPTLIGDTDDSTRTQNIVQSRPNIFVHGFQSESKVCSPWKAELPRFIIGQHTCTQFGGRVWIMFKCCYWGRDETACILEITSNKPPRKSYLLIAFLTKLLLISNSNNVVTLYIAFFPPTFVEYQIIFLTLGLLFSQRWP